MTADNIAALEKEVLKQTMRRYAEHRRQFPEWDANGHTTAAVKMIEACRKLYEAKKGRKT